MKWIFKLVFALLPISGAALADSVYGGGYYQRQGYQQPYDAVDAGINNQINPINIQEQPLIMQELQEGDYRGVERVIQQEEAVKQRLLQEEADYDAIRNQQMYQQPYGYR